MMRRPRFPAYCSRLALPAIAFVALLASGQVVLAGSGTEWVRLSPGWPGDPATEPQFAYDIVTAPIARLVALDGNGNTFSASRSHNGILEAYVLQKVAPDGNAIWSRTVDPLPGCDQHAVALSVDVAGDLIGTFDQQQAGFCSVLIELATVIKFSGTDGRILWHRRVGGAMSSTGRFVRDVGVDAQGNAFALFDVGFDFGFELVKLGADDGEIIWSANRQANQAHGAEGFAFPVALSLDDAGDVFIAGVASDRLAAMKFDGSNGSPAWSTLPGGIATAPFDYGHVEAMGIATDSAGDVIVLGDANAGWLTIKFHGASGNAAWSGLAGAAALQPDDQFAAGARALAVDDQGDVFVVGGLGDDINGGAGFAAVKYSGATGEKLWTALPDGVFSYKPDAFDLAQANDLAIDATGDVLIAGRTASFQPSDWLVLKLDGGSGALAWTGLPNGVAVYDGPGPDPAPFDTGAQDEAFNIEVDLAGDARIAGIQGGILNGDLAAMSIDGGTGLVEWVTPEGGQIPFAEHLAGEEFGLSLDRSRALAVDAAGNSYVVGSTRNLLESSLVAYRIDATGAITWQARYDDPSGNQLFSHGVAVDSNGDVFVSARRVSGSANDDVLVLKFDGPLATVQWSSTYAGPAAGHDRPVAMAVDGDGRLAITSRSIGAATGYDIVTRLLDADTGVALWTDRIDGDAQQDDGPTDLAVAADGDVIVTGFVRRAGSSRDAITVRHAADTGQPRWTAYHAGPGSVLDSGNALMLSADAGVFVAGSSGTQMLAIRYDANTGMPLWTDSFLQSSGEHLPAIDLGLDPNGDLTVLAREGAPPYYRLLVRKYAGATGAPLWNHLPEASARFSVDIIQGLVAHALTVDAQGDVWIAALEDPDGSDADTDWLLLGFDGTQGVLNARHEIAHRFGGVQTTRAVELAADGSLRAAGGSDSEFGPRMQVARVDPANPIAELVSLAPDAGTLAPAFSPTAHAYRIDVPATTDAISLAPTASSPQAQITVAGEAVASGAMSAPISLVHGSNPVQIVSGVLQGQVTRSAIYGVDVVRARFAQSITFVQPDDLFRTDAPLALDATSSAGLAVAIDSDTPSFCSIDMGAVQPLATGTCTLTASQPGDASHEPAAPVARSLTIREAVDLAVTVDNGGDGWAQGASVQYEVIVSNAGPGPEPAARLQVTPVAGLTVLGWSCSAIQNAVCPHTTGNGPIDETLDLGVAASLRFQVQASVTAAAGSTATLSAQVQVQSALTTDIDSANDAAQDSDAVLPDRVFYSGFESAAPMAGLR